MTNLAVVFLTGLTTGGLSCLAVQGGLLASSIAHQAEKDAQKALGARTPVPNRVKNTTKHAAKKRKHAGTLQQPLAVVLERPKRQFAWPIALFLSSKLVAYTILGVLLGWAGSVLQLTPITRAILQLAIGIFMVGTALRMFNVHPIFRYFVIEPPALLTRYIRRTAKNSTHDIATPLFLGTLTVLIPCGVTQAMMALAIGSGNPVLGAAIMFSFTLGASPVFFTLAYLTTRLGGALEAHFLKFAAVAVLILGIVSIDGGLNLMGAPLSLASITDSVTSALAAQSQQPIAANTASADSLQAAPGNAITITVGGRGYTPRVLRAKAGQPVKLTLVTNEIYGCTRAFVIPALDIQRVLPSTGETTIDLPAQAAGTLRFTCSMGMYRGQIQFE